MNLKGLDLENPFRNTYSNGSKNLKSKLPVIKDKQEKEDDDDYDDKDFEDDDDSTTRDSTNGQTSTTNKDSAKKKGKKKLPIYPNITDMERWKKRHKLEPN